MKKLLGITLVLLMVLSTLTFGSALGETAANGEPIKIAVVGPTTGDNAEYGQGFQNAAQMMVDQWNANGGVLGRTIQLLTYDDKNSSDEAASIAQKIVSEGDVVGVIGHFSSGVCLTAAPVYQENKIIEISPSASNPNYSIVGDYIFRNNTVITVEARAALDIATNYLGKKNVGILAIKTDWGTSTEDIVAQLIQDEYPDATITSIEEVLENSDDYSSAITKLHQAGTDVLICCSMYSTLAPVAIQYKQVDPNIQIVGFSNAYSQQLLQLGGSAVEGVCLPVIFFAGSTDPAIKAYVDEYTEKYGSTPSALTSQAYDSVGMLLTAIQKAGTTDEPTLRDTLANLEYTGVAGSTKFDENGDVTKTFVKLTIKDGQFVEIQ